MSDENKGTYTPARAKYIKKHMEKLDDIKIRVPKGRREYYKKLAENAGESLNTFAIRAMDYLAAVEGLDKN